VLCAVVLTQYRRVTDRRTDGIAVAKSNTALAMRARARCKKTAKCGVFAARERQNKPIDMKFGT